MDPSILRLIGPGFLNQTPYITLNPEALLGGSWDLVSKVISISY